MLKDKNTAGEIQFEHVIKKELEAIKAKREKCQSKDGYEKPEDNLFGIALSGGGIRSATVNFGVLEVLNKSGVLPKADYLSTVSGGGYIGGHVHAKLSQRKTQEQAYGKPYAELFTEEDIERLKGYGNYLTPGKRTKKFVTSLRFAGALVFSLLMNWICFFLLLLGFVFAVKVVIEAFKRLLTPLEEYLLGKFDSCNPHCYFQILIAASILVLLYHFFLHSFRWVRLPYLFMPLRRFKLYWVKFWSSNVLNYIEGFLLLFIGIFIFSYGIDYFFCPDKFAFLSFFKGESKLYIYFLSLIAVTAALLIIGLFADPNILTMHRFYRDRLAKAYLGEHRDLRVHELTPEKRAPEWGSAPYPLINSCLNLLGEKDPNFKGTKASDYFLLSPFYCGSKTTGYDKTTNWGFKWMTLSTAVAAAGAAVNPNMGSRTNRVLAFFMTLLNLRLGYWAWNPKYHFRFLTWWPYYHLMELFARTSTQRRRVNISDGGHIENLGVYELLRRRCKLVIAIDAVEDVNYEFSDLKNLVIRAKNELGISIKFMQAPESLIKPLPSNGLSKAHFTVANIEELPGKGAGGKIGVLVYVKSSMKDPTEWKDMAEDNPLYDSYKYKTYHPAFPHETTADQFFDKAQWEAYYYLGKFMAGELVNIDLRKTEDEIEEQFKGIRDKTINDWIAYFENCSSNA